MASVRVFSALVKGFARALNPWSLIQPTRPPLRSLRPLLSAAETARPQPLAAFARGFALKSASTVGRAGTSNGGGRRAARLPLYGFVVGLAYFGDEGDSAGDESSDVKAVAADLLLKQQKQDSRDVLYTERGAAAVRSLKDVTLLELLGWGCSGGVFAASVSKDVGHDGGESIALIADQCGHGGAVDSDVADSGDAPPPPPAPAMLSSRAVEPCGEHRATEATSGGSCGTGALSTVATVIAASSVAAQPSDAINRVAEKTEEWPEDDSVKHVRQPLRRQWGDAATSGQEQRCRCDKGIADEDDPPNTAIASSESFDVLSPLPNPGADFERPLDVAASPRHCMSDLRVSILHSSAFEDHSTARCESSFTVLSDSLVVVPSCASNRLYTEASVVDAGSGPSTSVTALASPAAVTIANDPAADGSDYLSWPKQPTSPMDVPSVQKHLDDIEETAGELSFEILPEPTSTAYGPLSPLSQNGSAKHGQRSFATVAVANATTAATCAITEAGAEQVSPSQPKLPASLRAVRSAFPGSCNKERQDAAQERGVTVWQSEGTLPVRKAPKASGVVACGPNHNVPMAAVVARPGGENRESGTASRCPASSTSIIAIKMLFNSPRALKAIGEELLPLAAGSFGRCTPLVRCGASHPNIVEMYKPFVDVVPDQLLQRLGRQSASLMVSSPSGRLVTVFLPMKRYACTLYSYIRLRDDDASTMAACTTVEVHARLACQLFEGVAFLESVGVAHRDLKSENILLEPCGCTHDAATDAQCCCSPKLVISDFGHALVGLRLPYERPQVSLGGNPAHRPPEILRALAGPDMVVDYSKSDAWAAGLIALEILTGGASRDRRLKHPERVRWLRQQQLLLLQHQRGANVNRRTDGTDDLHAELCRVVESLLEPDTSQRLSASDAASAVQLCLWMSDAVVEIALRRRAAAESLRAMVVGCIFSSSPMRGESQLRLSRDCRRRLGARQMCRTDVRLQLTFLERVDVKAVRTAACRLLCVH